MLESLYETSEARERRRLIRYYKDNPVKCKGCGAKLNTHSIGLGDELCAPCEKKKVDAEVGKGVASDPRLRYCPNNHDKDEVGWTDTRRCSKCQQERSKPSPPRHKVPGFNPARIKRKRTWASLSRQTGFNLATLQNWAHLRHSAPENAIKQLAEVLKVGFDDLLKEVERPSKKKRSEPHFDVPGLAAAKTASSMTWKELAEKVGCCTGTAKKWGQLKARAPESAIEKCAALLGVTPESLKTGSKKEKEPAYYVPGLKAAKEACGLTFLELSKKADVNYKTLKGWSIQKNRCFQSNIEKLASALDVTVEQLKGEESG